MLIDITFDASVANAPAGFVAAVDAAVQYLESLFDDPITVNIDVGWGEVGGQALPAGAIGASTASEIGLTYNEARAALWQNAITPNALTAAAALPASDPTNGGVFAMTTAEAKALGLFSPTDSAIDGAIGLDASTAFSFDPNNRAQPGLVDAIGVIEHEITEVLGRQSLLGLQPGDGSSLFGTLDLFRYVASGVLAPQSATGSFSIDGHTLLTPFNSPVDGGDSGDWAPSVTGDAFDAFADVGVAEQLSPTDLAVMDVLGFHPLAPMPTVIPPNVGPIGSIFTSQTLNVGQGQVLYFNNANVNQITLDDSPQNTSTAPSLTNLGTLVSIGDNRQTLIQFNPGGGFAGSTITNGPSGVMELDASGATGFAYGMLGSSTSAIFDNQGLFEVISESEDAVGIQTSQGAPIPGETFQFVNQAGAVFEVWGCTLADGVNALNTQTVVNAGVIEVTCGPDAGVNGSAVALGGVISLMNSGLIEAIAEAPGAQSIAVLYGAVTGSSFINSGTIEAEYAIVTGDGSSNVDIVNSAGGRILGNLEFGTAPSTVIDNSGLIAGNIFFSDSNATYNGGGGDLLGAIYLGRATNTVTLGPDGDTVYGGGGSDTITGGSGNDFFEIFRGTNAIDGGGGFNTLSFADSDIGVTVNLATGAATSVGTDVIKNIQEVIASDYNSTLIAGAAAATLVAGAGFDILTGGAGNDTLVAGAGGDSMTGGGGNNTFIYSGGDHQLVINDFDAHGDQDILKIYGYGQATSIQQQGADTLITLSSSDTILLKGVTAATLAPSIAYSQLAYAGEASPPSLPVFGSTTVVFDYDLRIIAGEALNANYTGGDLTQAGQFGLVDVQSHSFDNAGSVRMSAVTAFGLSFEQGDPAGAAAFVNEQSASFTTLGPNGIATGLEATEEMPAVTNAGQFTVSGAYEAIGIDTWQPQASVTNAATGVFTVAGTSAAAFPFGGFPTIYGMQFHNGGIVVNNGAIYVSGSGPRDLIGIEMDDAQIGTSITNGGVFQVTGGPDSNAVAIRVDSNDNGLSGFGAVTITNTGLIEAPTAIGELFEYATLIIHNSGVIVGDIDSGGSETTLRNTGSITGDINLFYNGNDGGIDPQAGDTIDLRGGTFVGTINIHPGLVGDVAVHDVIDTDNAFTLISLSGGESNLALTVNGAAGARTTIKLDISSGQASEVNNANGTWTIHAGADGTLALNNVQTLEFTDETIVLSGSVARDSFNGDGKSDFLIENTDGAAGLMGIGEVVNGQMAFTFPTAVDPSQYAIVGTGDFLGDGKSDLLIENIGSFAGLVGIGQISSGQVAFTFPTALTPSGQWNVVGSGDYLGDGKDQFLIENTGSNAGLVGIGEVNSGHVAFTFPTALAPSQWSIVGSGDYLGDGKSDILIQNIGANAGLVGIGEVSNGQVAFTFPTAVALSQWKFVATGDFLGDGKDQFLIENIGANAGLLGIGEVNNGQVAFTFPTTLASQWTVVGTGDYLGEGHDQFLLENTSGTIDIGDFSGGQVHLTQAAAIGLGWTFH